MRPVAPCPAFACLEACATDAAVADWRARLLGSPKRELREYATIHGNPLRIPSAHASGFKGNEPEP